MITKSAPHFLASEDIESVRTLAGMLQNCQKICDNVGVRINNSGECGDYLEGSDLRQFFDHLSRQLDSFRVNLRQLEQDSKEFDPDDVSREASPERV